MARKALIPIALLLLAAPLLAGCVQDDDVLRLAFVQPDDSVDPAEHPERLAEEIEARTGQETRLYYVDNTEMALQALAAGQADAAFVDGAAGWFGWQRLGLEAVAASISSDGRDHYIASAWVRADSPYQTVADLQGADSCHTGLLKSAGTFMPLGGLIGDGLVQPVGPDDLGSIVPTLDAFFGHVGMPGSDADVYGGYPGALRCLSEDQGDVAFGKDTTPASYCGEEPQDWCLPLEDYREMHQFGRVPSHPVMVGDISETKREALLDGLLSLSEDGQDLLEETLGSPAVVRVESSEAHLGDYAENLQHVPGMGQYLEGKLAQ